jgi:hypothetical protein
MTNMTNKELVNTLVLRFITDISVSMEQLDLIIQLQRSFETEDEAKLRKQHFQQLINKLGG